MPSFECKSVVRVFSDAFSLALKSRHHMIVGSAFDAITSTKARLPDNVEVLLASDLVLSLSGTLDGTTISSQDLMNSAVTNHLLNYLETNADQLGIDNISEPFIDKADDLLKLTLISSSCLSRSPRFPHVKLVSINLCYTWKTAVIPPRSQESCVDVDSPHPFASRLLLPVESILDTAVERFVSWHLVKRYPLIFGRVSKNLSLETTFFRSITSSIFNVIARSEDLSFRNKCQQLIKHISRQHVSEFRKSALTISKYLEESPDTALEPEESPEQDINAETVLSLSLERLYKIFNRHPKFKGIARMNLTISDDNDDRLDLSREESAELLPHLGWLPLSWNDPLMCTPSNNANDDDTIWNQYSSCDESVLSDSGDASLDILLDDTPYNGALDPIHSNLAPCSSLPGDDFPRDAQGSILEFDEPAILDGNDYKFSQHWFARQNDPGASDSLEDFDMQLEEFQFISNPDCNFKASFPCCFGDSHRPAFPRATSSPGEGNYDDTRDLSVTELAGRFGYDVSDVGRLENWVVDDDDDYLEFGDDSDEDLVVSQP